MISLKIRHILLLKVIKDYDGFNGKKNTQKIIYAFQTAKIMDFQYYFRTGFYGPFSEVLEQDINYLCEVGLLVEEPYGRIRVSDNLTNKSFFNKYKDFFKLFENNKTLEYKIVDIFEKDLRTSDRIELAISFIYLIISKEIHIKEDLFNAIDYWKPCAFNNDEKEDIWLILVQNNIFTESGELKFPITKSNNSKEILESYVYIENCELALSCDNHFIGFNEMLDKIYQDSFLIYLIKNILKKTECKYWDFKQTLDMWHTKNLLKEKKQIKFCEKVAAFANSKGGIIIIGITDKFPRKIIGISEIENKLQSIGIILNKWIDYEGEYLEVKEIILKDSNGMEKRCIAIIIAQTKDPIGVKNLDGYYSYPVRLETGLYRENTSKLNKKKKLVTNTNFNFLNFLNNGV